MKGFAQAQYRYAFDDSDEDVASWASVGQSSTQSAISTRVSSDVDSLEGSDCESAEPAGSPLATHACCLSFSAPSSGPNAWGPAVMVPRFVVPCMIVALHGCALQPGTGDDTCGGELTAEQNCQVATDEATTMRWHAGFGRWMPVHPIPAASEGEWQTREQKRQAAIELVMKSQEYNSCLASGCQPPQAPDPSDRTLSKRQWEMQIMKFRDAVKAMSVNLVPTAASASATSNSTRARWADLVDDQA